MKGHIREYDKLLPYDRLKDTYQTAVTRAESLDDEAERHDDRGRNPSTTVYKLTELIRTK